MLISPEYRALNETLHASAPSYGSHGHKWATEIAAIVAEYQCWDALDWGCGKATLSGLLTIPVAEYDPAVPQKRQTPDPAELVICTDVLEHIEPEHIDGVLTELYRLAEKVLFFNISTVPAIKTLADGRNPHLLVKPPEWWLEKLEARFEVRQWNIRETGVWGVAVPVREIITYNPKAATTNEIRNSNVYENIQLCSKRIMEAPQHERTATLVCFGPSLLSSLREIRGEDVFTVSGAHKVLVDTGIHPRAHIDCDPREHKARQFGTPVHGVEYWLASCVHPSWMDVLEGHDVSLWHLWNGDESAAVWDWEPEAWCCTGGPSVGLRAMCLLYALGYRRFNIHGMDCSFGEGGSHAAPHLGKPQVPMKVRCGDRQFMTSPIMVTYARAFIDQLQRLPDLNCTLFGDGLLQHMLRVGSEAAASENRRE